MFPHLLFFKNFVISFYVFEIGMTKNCSYLSKHWHKRCGLSSHCAHKCRKLYVAGVGQVNATAFLMNVHQLYDGKEK